MKYFYLIFIIIVAFVANTAGWAFAGKFYNSGNPGKCTFSDTLILSPGEKVDHPEKEKCAEVKCLDDQGYLLLTGCVLKPYIPNCKRGGPIDINAPYPKCCEEHLICNDTDSDDVSN